MNIEAMTNSPIFGLVNGIVGIVGILLAFYFYLKSKERFSLRYEFFERIIIERKSDRKPFDLDGPIIWEGVNIDKRLVRTYVLVRNAGNKLIEKSDVVGDIIVQTHESAKIVGVRVISADDPACLFAISDIEGHSARANFEFFRPREGAIFRVDHTGKLNQLFLSLRTKQAGPAKRVHREKRIKAFAATFSVIAAFVFLAGFAATWLGIVSAKIMGDVLAGAMLVLVPAFGLLFLYAIVSALIRRLLGRNHQMSTAKTFSLIGLDAPIEMESASS